MLYHKGHQEREEHEENQSFVTLVLLVPFVLASVAFGIANWQLAIAKSIFPAG
jgi:hypothetical protein